MRAWWLGMTLTLLTTCHGEVSDSDALPESSGAPVAAESEATDIHAWLAQQGFNINPDTAAETPYENVFEPTEKLVSTPAVREAVDALARESRVNSHAVGIGGDESPPWTKYLRLVELASPEDKVALLFHRSPVVRGYIAQYASKDMPAAVSERRYSLLADATAVDTQSGCIVTRRSIALLAFESLLPDDEDARRPLFLVRVVSDERVTYGVRAAALTAMAKDGHPQAHAFAVAGLGSSNTALLRAALRAFQYVGEGDDFDRVAPFARLPTSEVRDDAATGLGGIGSVAAVRLLEELMTESDWSIRISVLRAYGAHPLADHATLRTLLRDDDARSDIARGISNRNAEEAFALFEPALMEDETHIGLGSLLGDLVDEIGAARAIPRMRRLLGSIDPRVRRTTHFALANAGDRASIPAIRAMLRDGDMYDVRDAAEVLVKLGVRESVPEFTKQLESDNPDTVVYAARALVAFRARSAIPALARAAHDAASEKESLEQLLVALRNGTDAPEE